jgi:formate dehydrogenase maturation protein FdhE
MIIRSKYATSCRKCHDAITAGQQIEWTKERGAQHITCSVTYATGIRIQCLSCRQTGRTGYAPFKYSMKGVSLCDNCSAARVAV